MAKIVVFMPNALMVEQAQNAIRENQLDAKVIFTDSEHVLSSLEKARESGAMVAVARGNHAHLIKDNSDMPLAEIILTGQELAILIDKAQSLLEHPDDKIALIGFSNMFSDPQPIARVLGANVRLYCAKRSQDIKGLVQNARDDKAKIVIGGQIAIDTASQFGMKTLFMDSMQGSITNALLSAKRILYGIELEKMKTNEFMSLLNYSFDAILKLDKSGHVLIANYLAEKAFHSPASQLMGMNILDLMDIPKDSAFASAIMDRKNAYSATVKIKQEEYVANLAVIKRGEIFDGFILSMQEFKHIHALEDETQLMHASSAYQATHTLNEYQYPSSAMVWLKESAAVAAQYDLPVLLVGKYGTDKLRLAESIHNASIRAKKPFVCMDIATMLPAMQEGQMMMTENGNRVRTAFENAAGGTVLIENIELLSSAAQTLLMNICKNHWLLRADGRNGIPVDCRIICTASEDLFQRIESGAFLRALYIELSRLELRLPDLSERAEDMPVLLEEKMKMFTQRYRKYVHLTADMKAALYAQRWPTDEMGFTNFVEKLVLFSPTYEVADEVFSHLMAAQKPMREDEPTVIQPIVSNSEELELISMMEKFRGNRSMMASALGISKTTLWRRLKKYGLQDRLNPGKGKDEGEEEEDE